MTNSNNLVNQAVITNSPLLTSEILPREEKYIVITKRELTHIDDFTNWLDWYSEACLIFASGLFGFCLNLIPSTHSIKELSFSNVIIIATMCILFFLGFSAKFTKITSIQKILKEYEKSEKLNQERKNIL